MRISNPSARYLVVFALVAAGLIAGCGGGDSTSDSAATTTANADKFPTPDNESLQQIAQQGDASDSSSPRPNPSSRPARIVTASASSPSKHDAVDDADIALYAAQATARPSGPSPRPSTPRSRRRVHLPDDLLRPRRRQVLLHLGGRLLRRRQLQPDRVDPQRRRQLLEYANVTAPAKVGNPKNVPQPGDQAPMMHTPTARTTSAAT